MFSSVAYILLFVTQYSDAYDECRNSHKVCNVAIGECCSENGWCGFGEYWCNERSLYGYEETSAMVTSTIEPKSNTTAEGTTSTTTEVTPSTTPEVTSFVPRPTVPKFTGCACIITGDPHIHQWNCRRINYQGPHGYTPAGEFHYVTACNDFTKDHLPVQVRGTHARWNNYFTVLDYLTVLLYEGDTVIKYIKIAGDTGVTESYNNTIFTNVTMGTYHTIGRFSYTWTADIFGIVSFRLDDKYLECGDALTITTQRLLNEVEQESAHIRLGDCYKGYTCGLCGNFIHEYPHFEMANGDITIVDDLYFGKTAENFDAFGYLVEGSYGEERERRLSTYQVSNLTSACLNLDNALNDFCTEHLSFYEDCCHPLQGYCERNAVPNCMVDSCACISTHMQANNITDVDDLYSQNIVSTCVVGSMAIQLNYACHYPENDYIIPDDTLQLNTGICSALLESYGTETQTSTETINTVNVNTKQYIPTIIILAVLTAFCLLLSTILCYKVRKAHILVENTINISKNNP